MAQGDDVKTTAKPNRSIFTQSLAGKLEAEGVNVPPHILDLLDKPFASFSEADKQVYESQVKGKDLLRLFSRLLLQIYESQSEAAKHSWRGMGFLLKDSPIKVCVTYVIKHSEEEQEREVSEVAQGWSRTAAGSASPQAAGGGADASRKSYFTKKLERKLEERAIKVPAPIMALLDKPYDEFTPEDRLLYDREFEGRQLKILFSDLLDELFEETGRVASGWTAMCRFLKDTPIKDMAEFVIAEEERLEVMAQEPSLLDDSGQSAPAREKIYVKPYRPATEEKPSRWKKKA